MIVTAHDLLMAYDQQLHAEAETSGASQLTRIQPSLADTLIRGQRLHAAYWSTRVADARKIPRLVEQALDHYRQNPTITWVEWKT